MMPFFFACKSGADVFICIRGAAEPADFLHVLDFDREAFAGGQAHRGCLRAARWIVGQCRRVIDECRGRIICCGHSLGGATSGMVASILILEENRRNVIGVCQGPFPIVSADVSRRLEPFITTFVFENDVFPRMTAANIGAIIRMFVPPGSGQAAGIAMIQGIIQQMIGGIIQMNPFARYTDESVRTLQAQMPQVVMRLVASAQGAVVEEFLLPGKACLIGLNKADGSA
jgi:hypothetical protein